MILQIDTDGSGFLNVAELQDALELCGIRIPAYQVRELIQQFDTHFKDDKIQFEEFKQVSSLYALMPATFISFLFFAMIFSESCIFADQADF